MTKKQNKTIKEEICLHEKYLTPKYMVIAFGSFKYSRPRYFIHRKSLFKYLDVLCKKKINHEIKELPPLVNLNNYDQKTK